ncbi:hypothetical protein HPP92_007224 [Vanilla planifolia]|uniref:Uncharacterized protein n=1 Tax=Vanilla planifolia TaxID=51239 RepID=A0A835RDG3_VANPL|nr:hypothetical protein HPP92_007224 [Vanilla planifolia]
MKAKETTSLGWRRSERWRRCSEEAGLLQLELIHLCLTIHLDNEGDDEDEESRASDPCSLTSAPKELFRDGGNLTGSIPPFDNDRSLRDLSEDASILATRSRKPPSLRRH